MIRWSSLKHNLKVIFQSRALHPSAGYYHPVSNWGQRAPLVGVHPTGG